MIRTLVVDDDYRVARIHAASVDRVPGFTCVGQALNASEARRAVAELRPDLLLLDVYLPDEDGLALLRSLSTPTSVAPDCIVITAARDMRMIGAAMQLGARYYLVKPFGFAKLRDQLEAYRRWRDELASCDEGDQATVDNLYSMLHGLPQPGVPRRRLPPTMQKVLDVVSAAGQALSAAQVADRLGVSRPTAQRHLTELERQELLELELEYGTTGRPIHLYRLR